MELEAALKKIEDLQGEAKGYRVEKKAVKEELDILKGQMAKFDGIDLDEFKRLQKEQKNTKEDKLKAENNFDELLKSKLEEGGNKVLALQKENDSLRESNEVLIIDNDVTTSISPRALNSKQVLKLIRDDIKMVEGKPHVIVDGKRLFNSNGDGMTPGEYGNKFLDENPQHAKASGGGGGSNGNGQGDQGTKELVTSKDHIKAGLEARKNS